MTPWEDIPAADLIREVNRRAGVEQRDESPDDAPDTDAGPDNQEPVMRRDEYQADYVYERWMP